METPDYGKLSSPLASIYRSWVRLEREGWSSGYDVPDVLEDGTTSLMVGLNFRNALAPIAALGFVAAERISETFAYGHLKLEHLAAVSRHADVVLIEYDRPDKASLDTSSLAIGARDSTAGLANGVWHFTSDPAAFSGNTGEGVVIGIIDTGIDWGHEYFRTLDGNDTRILAIWDMQLTPQAGESSPSASLLASSVPYGVEYEAAAIRQEIVNPVIFPSVRHSDTSRGHGTHVAGIAAGNGRPGNDNIGVAPKANLIVVNYLASQGKVTVGGSKVSSAFLFEDALHYIRNKARAQNPGAAVVINCSLGSEFGAHDGRGSEGSTTKEEILRRFRFPPPGSQEVTGSAVIFSSGNYAGRRAHVEATLGSTALTLPFSLLPPGTAKPSKVKIECWYGNTGGSPPTVTCKVNLPGGVSTQSVGRAANDTKTFDTNKIVEIDHQSRTAISTVYGNSQRHCITVEFKPFNGNYRIGSGYSLELTGDAGTKIFIWTEKEFQVQPRFDLSSFTGATPAARFSNQSTCGSPGHCPDVITVANYDDTNNHLYYSSSRGPLVDYNGVGTLPAAFHKPDVAAPGTDILSASVSTCRCCRKLQRGKNYTSKSGTSMAAPHVTGIVALLLKNDPTLTQTRIRDLLRGNPGPETIRYLPAGDFANRTNTSAGNPAATPLEVGTGTANAKRAVAALAAVTPPVP